MANPSVNRSYHVKENLASASKEDFAESLVLEEHPIPSLGPHDVLIQIHAVSLNWRDIMVATGTYYTSPKHHVIPCSDGAGIIVKTGSNVTRFKTGDRAAAIFAPLWIDGLLQPEHMYALGGELDGVLQEYAVFNEESLVHIPEHLSFEEASTLPCAGVTAWNALFGHGDRCVGRVLRPGETVVTQGTGGVSLFAAQFAQAAGADAIATTSTPAKAQRLTELIGVSKIINYKDQPSWGEVVKKLSAGGKGADFVIEVMGDTSTLTQSYKAAKPEAQISVIGTRSKSEQKHAPEGSKNNVEEMTMTDLLKHVVSTRRIRVGSRQHFEAMNDFIHTHQIRPVVDPHIFEFDEAREAFQYLRQGQQFGNVVIRIKHLARI